MPSAAPKACKHPFCPALVADGSYFCPKHTPEAPKRIDTRLSSAQRGYDAVWRKFRAWFIVRHPICADCGIEATTDVHHIKKLADHPELRTVESNCMGLCSTCHKRRTARGE